MHGSGSNGNGRSNGSNGAGRLNGSASTLIATAVPINAGDGVEGFQDPCESGQLEACAMERIAERELQEQGVLPAASGDASSSSAQGTPYSNPGGRWSNFRKYSTFQVRNGALWRVVWCSGGSWRRLSGRGK